MEATILLELERAELAARERRLAAETEAEEELVRARAAAIEIMAGVEHTIAQGLEARRRELESEADAEIRALEAELAAMADPGRPTAADPALGRATELVVAAVLGETPPEPLPTRPGGAEG